jgi:hypothetical protein
MGNSLLSPQAIVTIASGGFMALATLFLLIILLRRRAHDPAALRAALVVIGIGAVIQIIPPVLWSFVTPQVSVNFSPGTKNIGSMIGLGEPLKSKPILWLEGGNVKCNPDTKGYTADESDCPSFQQRLPLTSRELRINIYADDVMLELHDRIMRISSAQAVSLHSAPPSSLSVIGEN